VGIISDTHGLLRPEAVEALRGSSLIIHAGDMGSDTIIPNLETIAPIYAVRGNVDNGPWAYKIPKSQSVEIEGVFIYVYHGHQEPELNPETSGFQVVVSGHSHQPSIETRNGILFINPGSAGPKRFRLPVSLAIATIHEGKVTAELLELEV
jgi:uncharacterized protein